MLQKLNYNPQYKHLVGSQISEFVEIALLNIGGHKIAIEIVDESKFARNQPNLPLANSMIKKQLLQGCGWKVVWVNVNEWYFEDNCVEYSQNNELLLERKIVEQIGVLVLG
eukprot:TRINITY_DN50431_c0_g1_i3.p5 TRINITY_DN50431_c0_g1~~TRINITY_DN50431_c0_g1_i3.p5  ORF type:complete len:111 (-),score=11.13 TRINITY_DN50431_c0_g1_i3:233-565(-)